MPFTAPYLVPHGNTLEMLGEVQESGYAGRVTLQRWTFPSTITTAPTVLAERVNLMGSPNHPVQYRFGGAFTGTSLLTAWTDDRWGYDFELYGAVVDLRSCPSVTSPTRGDQSQLQIRGRGHQADRRRYRRRVIPAAIINPARPRGACVAICSCATRHVQPPTLVSSASAVDVSLGLAPSQERSNSTDTGAGSVVAPATCAAIVKV
jgi:hypothetical protein